MVNTGEATAPYTASWHPYFRLGDDTDDIDDLELPIPPRIHIGTDAALIPVKGPELDQLRQSIEATG